MRRNWYSDGLRAWHFWLWTIGIVVMFIDLTISGLIVGFMQRELNPWVDMIQASIPFWWVRTFAGGMMVAGVLCLLYNMWMTTRSEERYVEESHLVPEEAN